MSDGLPGVAEGATPTLPIVVYVGDFDENVGGTIVLQTLAYRLLQNGCEVYLAKRPRDFHASRFNLLGKMYRALKVANRRRLARRKGHDVSEHSRSVRCHASMPVPTLPANYRQDVIAVYPEIVSRNPLRARHVVRWLLHRPGFHLQDVEFNKNELTFFYQHEFAKGLAGIDPGNHLQVRWLRDDIYRDEGVPVRSGRCRMVRKGENTFSSDMAAGDGAPLLDGKSHAEIAQIFNRSEFFYSHDPHTMYLYYAALCGCVPVVVPQPGLDAETWRAGFEMKQGVAYGDAEIPFAVATRPGLLADMETARGAEDAAVKAFIVKIKANFGC